MTQGTRRRLFLLVLLVAALTGFLVTPASQSAHAQMCCETCGWIYEWCLAGTAYPNCHGNSYCCADKVGECDQTCYWC
jgi:hypothetical protein